VQFVVDKRNGVWEKGKQGDARLCHVEHFVNPVLRSCVALAQVSAWPMLAKSVGSFRHFS
jgi:hypothetical protein